jgi:hypothetical protein
MCTPDPNFDPNENLYRRYKNEHIPNGQPIAVIIKFPNCSVNRGRYSNPDDVIQYQSPRYLRWGVMAFQVENVPAQLPSSTSPTHTFIVEHTPREDNFSHSEIRAFRVGNFESLEDLPKLIKKEFRTLLSLAMIILKSPDE